MKAQLDRQLVGVLLFCWIVTVFTSRAPSPDYRVLFWCVLPIAMLYLALVVLLYKHAPIWGRWSLVVLSSLAFQSFLELALAAWLPISAFD